MKGLHGGSNIVRLPPLDVWITRLFHVHETFDVCSRSDLLSLTQTVPEIDQVPTFGPWFWHGVPRQVLVSIDRDCVPRGPNYGALEGCVNINDVDDLACDEFADAELCEFVAEA